MPTKEVRDAHERMEFYVGAWPMYKKPSTAKFKRILTDILQENCSFFLLTSNLKMHSYAVLSFIFGVVITLLTTSVTEAAVISCPPSTAQEQANPAIRQLCYAIEQAMDEAAPAVPQPQFLGRLDERNTNLNSKRQDVDHVFLRFGRRFGF